MKNIIISEKKSSASNLFYIQSNLAEILGRNGFSAEYTEKNERVILEFTCPECYYDIFKTEIISLVSEIIAINYKNKYFINHVKISGLNPKEKSILISGIISADFNDDKNYILSKIKIFDSIAIDGIYNFMIKPLIKKWQDIVDYLPLTFLSNELKEFIGYLLENRKKTAYIDGEKVYDGFYRRLRRAELLDGESLKLIREVILSDSGNLSVSGTIPKEDEYYLKEFYGDKISFTDSKYNLT